MTGFGRTQGTVGGHIVEVEAKAINSKMPDIKLKIPHAFRNHENEIKRLVHTYAERGKIEVQIIRHLNLQRAEQLINVEYFLEYARILKNLCNQAGLPDHHLPEAILKMPEVIEKEEEQLISENEWRETETLIQQCFHELQKQRMEEGSALERDLLLRIEEINTCIEQIVPFEEERNQLNRQRLQTSLQEHWMADQIDKNRFEQELLYYLEKNDITEEKVRLRQHILYFTETLKANTTEKGRKLNFISQEMGREINTLGAKAYHSDIQRLVVMMKDALEKIKEQIANVV